MKDMSNDYVSVGFRLELSGTLGLIFVVLKLIGVIDWSWWWVLSPIWIGVIINLVATIIYTVIIVRKMKEWDE